MNFDQTGFEFHRKFVSMEKIDAIRSGIFEIMIPFCDVERDDPDALDKCFYEISRQGNDLKSNCYQLFGRLMALPSLLNDPNISRRIESLGFGMATIQSYSVFCLEPGNERNMFLPHQDLRERTSQNSLIIWVPLSSGDNIGGMACYPGTHVEGPIEHAISEGNKVLIPGEAYRNVDRAYLTDFEVGDCILMSPYLIHESIENTGSKIRWTAVVKIDSAVGLEHLDKSIHPFSINEYIDLRTNAERLAAAAQAN
jgi:hypothetical protein